MELRNLAAKLSKIDALEERVSQLEMMMLEIASGVPEGAEVIGEAEVLTLPDPTAAARPEWVSAAHNILIEWATKPTRLGTPRANSLTDGRYVYLSLHLSSLASQKAVGRPYQDMYGLRLPENAHPLITWMRGPRSQKRANDGGTETNRSNWVRVETGARGVADKRISPEAAALMFEVDQ